MAGAINVRLVGQSQLEAAAKAQPEHAEDLYAWMNEMRHRVWTSPSALEADFQGIDITKLPAATFRVGSPPLLIETLFDLRAGVVLVLGTTPLHGAASTRH